LEINRAIPCQFTIELKGNILLASDAQLASLKIFDLRDVNVGAKHNILEILDDFEIAKAFENHYVEDPIINDSMLKKRERPSVKSAISDKNKRSFFQRSMLRLDEQPWRLPCGDLRCGDQIA
jgi:hypothetical protein